MPIVPTNSSPQVPVTIPQPDPTYIAIAAAHMRKEAQEKSSAKVDPDPKG